MHSTFEKCEKMARQLPVHERALLIEHLFHTLDELNEAECEELWIAETERRYGEYKKGNIPAKPAEEALTNARERLASFK